LPETIEKQAPGAWPHPELASFHSHFLAGLISFLPFVTRSEVSQSQGIIDRAQQVLIHNYARVPVVMARGEGCRLWDADGREYLDLLEGFGGCILGHCHPALVRAATDQANKLWHVGNTFHTEPQVEFAERLNKTAFRGQAFFCHSGAEANEAACKLARLRGHEKTPHRWKIISFNKSFHGRTLAMIGIGPDGVTRKRMVA